MPTVPASVSAQGIAGEIQAAPHNSNYAAMQTAINAIIAALSAGVGGQTLTGSGTTLTWSAPTSPTAPTRGTTLPGAPADGQEHILVDSLTSPTYQWQLRYSTANTTAYKWEFVGGAPRVIEVATTETTASTSYAALATAGPSFTVPNAGVWLVTHGATINHNAIANMWMSYDIAGTGAVDADAITNWSDAGTNDGGSMSRVKQQTFAAATTALVSKYKVNTGTATFRARWLQVVPVRIA